MEFAHTCPARVKSDSLERFVGPVSPPESSQKPDRFHGQIYRPSVYQGAFGEAAFTAAGFEGWLLAVIGGDDGLPAPKCRTAATLKQAKANIANQDHRVF